MIEKFRLGFLPDPNTTPKLSINRVTGEVSVEYRPMYWGRPYNFHKVFMFGGQTEVHVRTRDGRIEFGSPCDEHPLLTADSVDEIVEALRTLADDMEKEKP